MVSKLSTIAIENTPAERRYWTLLLAVCLSFVFVQVFLAPTLPLTYEEGTNLLVGQLSSQGYQPYTQIFTMLSPSFVWLMAWLGRLGLSPTDFRLVFLVFGLLLLVNTSIITRTLLGIKVALATVILLATATSFLAEAATTIVPLNPAMSIGTLALVFTLQHINTEQRLWLLIGGAAWGIALFLSTSVFSLGLLAMIFIILLDRGSDNTVIFSPERWQGKFRAILLWLVGALVTLGVGIVWATPDIIFGHLMADYLTIRENLAITQAGNFRLFGPFAILNSWLFLFAIYSLVRVYDNQYHTLWVVLIWIVLSFCWLMLQVTLRPVDVTIILPPLAMMAGWGVVDIGYRLKVWSQRRKVRSRGWETKLGAAILLLLGLYMWASWQLVPKITLRDIDTAGDLQQLEQRPDVVRFIHHHADPDDCVIIDDPALAVVANRLPAPQLIGLSRERIVGGLISEEALETLAQAYDCKVIVFSKRKYTLPLIEFKNWAKTYYPNEQKFTRTDIYYQ